MPLFIGDRAIQELLGDLPLQSLSAAFIHALPEVQASSQSFLSTPVASPGSGSGSGPSGSGSGPSGSGSGPSGTVDIGPSGSSLFVYENEAALHIPDDVFEWVGSDDATTCHILFAKVRRVGSGSSGHGTGTGTGTGKSMITHIVSESACREVFKMLELLASDKSTTDVDVYVSGGMGDDELSAKISHSLLHGMASLSTVNCHLQLFNTCSLNTIVQGGVRRPRSMGMGCHFIKTPTTTVDTVFQHDYDNGYTYQVVPMRFPVDQRGPATLLRRCYTFAAHPSESDDEFEEGGSCEGEDTCVGTGQAEAAENTGTTCSSSSDSDMELPGIRYFRVVYNGAAVSQQRRMQFRRFSIQMDQRTIRILLSWRDDVFLAHTSTSPDCEPAHFVPQMREVLGYLRGSSGTDSCQDKVDQFFTVAAGESQEAAASAVGNNATLAERIVFELSPDGSKWVKLPVV